MACQTRISHCAAAGAQAQASTQATITCPRIARRTIWRAVYSRAMKPAFHERSAADLAAAYRTRELSPVEATRAALARIGEFEPRLNAIYRVDREGAFEQARAAEARWEAGRPLSALDGVPLTIKENIYTRGAPAPIGTRANDDAPPQPEDAPPAARLREAGCVILGKTTMPDYGMLSSGVSSLHGVTRNPWRLDRNPSGSSSRAAAAAGGRGTGGGRGGGLRRAARGHRLGRFAAPAGNALRHLRAQAIAWPRAG